MIPVSYFVAHEYTSPKFAYAFAKGCHGTITDDLEYLHPGPVALFGSPPAWPLLRQARAAGRDFYYADHAYFGRGRYFRVTKNAYHHDGTGAVPVVGRFAKATGKVVQPWRKTGSHVLICPQSSIYFSLHGIDADQWLEDVKAELRQHTDREIRVRWKASRTPIQPDLDDAWAVVVFSSAAALDALIAGVPIVTLAPFACSRRMGLTDLSQIESPIYPDGREHFLEVLANNQWSMAEMIRGMAWTHLRETHEQAA